MKKIAKEKKWKTTDNRFVVFLDIMGFKDFVSRNSHEQVYDMMSKLSLSKEIIDTTLEKTDTDNKYKEKGLYTTSFSDSLVLFSKDDSAISFEMITGATSFLFEQAMIDSIPMKGAIAHGVISVNKTKQIYFGQPLIDAYLLQEEVNYYGVVFHNSVDNYIYKHSKEIDNYTKNSYSEIKTPLKSGLITHNNVNWFSSFNDPESNDDFDIMISKLKTITSGKPRKYIDNTIVVYETIYKNKKEN